MVRRRSGRSVLAAAASLLTICAGMAGVAHGSIVVSVSGPGLGFVGPIIIGSNSIDYTLTFSHMAPIDMALSAVPAGPLLFSTIPVDTILNSTGTTWTEYHFLLGTGSGDTFTRFNPATNQGLDFLASPPPSTPAPFVGFLQFPDGLGWFGIKVPNGDGIDFAFAVNVPSSISAFTLRQFPAALPEPSTLFLLGLGIAGIPVLTWRRSRHTELRSE